MGHIITPDFIQLFEDYPPYSQDGVRDPLVIVKLFDVFSPATWFLIEYNSKHKVALGYVVGIMQDELGFIAIDDLENKFYRLFDVLIPYIERDIYFQKKPLSEALKNHRRTA